MPAAQLEAYLLTLVLEGLVAALIGPRLGGRRAPMAFSAVLGSALSHPVVWPAFYALLPTLGGAAVLVVEAFAVLVEAPFYRVLARVGWARAFLGSLLVNAASYGAGLLIQALR